MGKSTISMAIFQFAFCMFTRPGKRLALRKSNDSEFLQILVVWHLQLGWGTGTDAAPGRLISYARPSASALAAQNQAPTMFLPAFIVTDYVVKTCYDL